MTSDDVEFKGPPGQPPKDWIKELMESRGQRSSRHPIASVPRAAPSGSGDGRAGRRRFDPADWAPLQDPVGVSSEDLAVAAGLRQQSSKDEGGAGCGCLLLLLLVVPACWDHFTDSSDEGSLASRETRESHAARSGGSGTPSVSVPAVVFDQPVLPLPRTGIMATRGVGSGLTGTIAVETRGGQSHFFLKVVSRRGGSTEVTAFVRAGERVELDVPLGSYDLRYATGAAWYGTKHLFGPKTRYSRADSVFDIKWDGSSVWGWTVELYEQRGGNLRTEIISPNDF